MEVLYERGTYIAKIPIQKDKELDLWAEPPRLKICWVTPPPLVKNPSDLICLG